MCVCVGGIERGRVSGRSVACQEEGEKEGARRGDRISRRRRTKLAVPRGRTYRSLDDQFLTSLPLARTHEGQFASSRVSGKADFDWSGRWRSWVFEFNERIESNRIGFDY